MLSCLLAMCTLQQVGSFLCHWCWYQKDNAVMVVLVNEKQSCYLEALNWELTH